MPSACPRCGAIATEGSQFCETCGAPLSAAAVPPGGPVPPAGTAPPGGVPGPYAPVAPPPGAPPAGSVPPGSAASPPPPPQPPQPQAVPAPAVPGQPAPVPPQYYQPTGGYPAGTGGAVPPGAVPPGGPVPPGGGYYVPPGGPPAGPPPSGRPRNRLSPLVLALCVAGVLALAVIVGVAVPKLISHNTVTPTVTPTTSPSATPTTAPAATTTTTVQVTTTTSSPASTTTAPPATTTTAPAPVTTSTPATTAPPNTTPATTVPSSAPSGVAKNSVASATLVSGWTEDSSSTADNLALDGPNGLSADVGVQQAAAGTTLSDVFSKQLSNFQGDSNFTDVSMCQQPQSATVPGTPAVPGGAAVVCFTVTPQGATAEQYYALIFDGLATLQGSSNLALVTELAFVPTSASQTEISSELKPVLQSVRWLVLSSS